MSTNVTADSIKELRGLWGLLFPGIPVPQDSQLALWLAQHEPDTVKKGFVALGVKLQKVRNGMDFGGMLRYASGVMINISREQTQQSERSIRL